MAEHKNKRGLFSELTKGLLEQNPLLVLVLGTCPSLAVTTNLQNAVGMGLAATFVLFLSNSIISAIRNFIPDKVRIPCYITVIASCVTVLDFLVQAFVPALAESLGIFLPLITVNCIILGRAEAFANKNTVLRSALDGIGMGLGFTCALIFIGGIREILGAGSIWGYQLPFIGGDNYLQPMLLFIMPPGGFMIFGLAMACAAALTRRFYSRHPEAALEAAPSCGCCALNGMCGAGSAASPEDPASTAAQPLKTVAAAQTEKASARALPGAQQAE